MDLSRRFFLGGALAVAATAVVKPALAAVKAFPVLHGDGVTDDAPALNALFRGEPVMCEGELIERGPGDPVYLTSGIYKVGTTLLLARDFTMISGATFLTTPDFDGDYVLRAPEGRKYVTIHGCRIINSHGPKNVGGFRIEASYSSFRLE